ncbi:CBS domain-containing protein [Enterococcus sp. AZ103]|uniref:CBS domain-containing protein n=1 Tax=Enterococcus sp. AZ103 TaxID=2774628 RepID=UPI003F20AD21
MGERADDFLTTFNRIEKEVKSLLGNPVNLGFSEAVRRLAKKQHDLIGKNENDLLQLAQLRNAIVHDQIADDFVIAEPNEWAVQRIKEIEKGLLSPEKVLPRFAKKVTGFEQTVPMREILETVKEKRYSQFPVYDHGKFLGLITLRTIGLYLSELVLQRSFDIFNKKVGDFLIQNGKNTNFEFVSADTNIAEVEEKFQQIATLEAILITKDGNRDGNLLGIIRPRDILN